MRLPIPFPSRAPRDRGASSRPLRPAARRVSSVLARAVPGAWGVAALVALGVGALLLARPTRLAAQVTTLDEGSFTVTRGGTKLGREEFRIVRQPAAGGVAYSARALGAYGERRVAPALQTDERGTPLRYQVEVRRGAALEQRLTGQVAGGHFVTQASTPGGEASREYGAPTGWVTLDDEVWHQYFALGLGGRADTATAFTIFAPRHNEVATLRVVGRERTTLTLDGAGGPIDALRLTLAGPGGARREVWLDRAGRVLRVALPAEGLVAQRDEPPR